MSQFRSNIELVFPVLGEDRSLAEQRQRPFTCRQAINVRPEGVIEGRDRGGSRPGIHETVRSDGDGFTAPPRMMATVDVSPDFTGSQTAGLVRKSAFDGFDGAAGSPFGADWFALNDTSPQAFDNPNGQLVVHEEVNGEGGAVVIADLSTGVTPTVLTRAGLTREPYPDMNVTAQSYTLKIRIFPDFNAIDNFPLYPNKTAFFLFAKVFGSGMETAVVATLVPRATLPVNSDNPAPPYEYLTVLNIYNGGFLAFGVAGTVITRNGPEGGVFSLTVDPVGATTLYLLRFQGEETLSHTATPEQELPGFGSRFGFGMQVTGFYGGRSDDFQPARARVESWAVDYRETSLRTPVKDRRRVLIASDGAGVIWEERVEDRPDLLLEEVPDAGGDNPAGINLRSDVQLAAHQHAQRLFIADHGPIKFRTITGRIAEKEVTVPDETLPGAGTADNQIDVDNDVLFLVSADSANAMPGGYKIVEILPTTLTLDRHPDSVDPISTLTGVEFVIVRSPKVYDPRSLFGDKLSIWVSNDVPGGTVPQGGPPVGCHIITVFNDRIVMAGFPSNVWYMSRQGDPFDWRYDFAGSETDLQRPIISTSADAGAIAEPVTAAIPHSYDYFMFTSKSQIWWMRGDPARGGTLENISYSIGVIDQFAWTHGPNDTLIFMALDGIYGIRPSPGALPESISRNRLPRELISVDTNVFQVTLSYDVEKAGVHIYVTPRETSVLAQHWWMDFSSGGFFRVRIDPDHDPFHVLSLANVDLSERGVLMACRDGKFRTYNDGFQEDDGKEFQSEVWYGPIRLGGSERSVGILAEMQGTLDDNSAPVTWEVYVGDTAASAFLSSPHSTGVWSAGVNSWVRPRAKGSMAFVRIINRDQAAWAIETIAVRRKLSGRRKSGEGMVRRSTSSPATFAAGR